MVAPIVGPETRVSGSSSGLYFKQERRFKQSPPYNLPTASSSRTCWVHTSKGWMPGAGSNGASALDPRSDRLVNVAYSRFLDKARDSASIGAAMAEMSDSFGMIAKRASQLVDFTRAVRRLDPRAAARALNVKVPKGSSRIRQASGLYLEFHFGWSPMIGDIYDAIDVIQSPLKTSRPRGSASMRTRTVVPPKSVNIGPHGSRTTTDYFDRCAMGAEVSVSNPNLWLANQLGLINPATILWEIVPFSFVLDWFVDVQGFLSSATDLYGLRVDRPWTTRSCHARDLTQWGWAYGWVGGTEGVSIERRIGLTGPGLRLKTYRADNLRRALSQVSLLVVLSNSFKRA